MTPAEIDREIYVAKWQTEGHDPDERDYAYWREKAPELIARGIEINFGGGADPGRAYMREKLIGWQATGADLPTYGPYAVPPAPFHALPAEPTPVEPQPNNPPAPVYGDIQDVLAVVNRIEVKLELLATKADIAELREEFKAAVKQLPALLATLGLGGIFGRREATKKKQAKK